MNQKLKYGIISGFFACIVGMVYWYFVLVNAPEGVLGVKTLGNIKSYAIFLAFIMVIFFICFALLSFLSPQIPDYPVVKYGVAVIGIVGVGFAVYPHVSNVWGYPLWITVVLGLLLTAFILFGVNGKTEGWKTIFFLIVAIGILWGIGVAAICTFRSAPHGAFYDLHHSSAYMDSIFNVFRHMAFEGGLTDQYGHYALFFYVPMKLFGCSTVTVAVLLGILSAATYILCMCSFCMAVKSNTIRVVIVVLAGIAGINPALGSIYWQCYPHRLIFPAITIFMITLFAKQGLKLWKYIVGTGVITLALLWNFESGIICSAAWLVFSIMFIFSKKRISKEQIIACVLAMVVDVIVPLFLALGIVNLYNIIVSDGETIFLGIKSFVGMVVDDTYISYLSTDIPWGNDLYIHKIIVFLACFVWGLLHNKLLGVRGNKIKAYFSISVSLMGLGLMTYYMNRTLAGNALVDLFFVLCLGIILSGFCEFASKKMRINKASVVAVCKAVCGLYACFMLVGIGMTNITVNNNFQEKFDTKVYDYSLFRHFTKEIKSIVPSDTWAKGEGTTAIYMELGWKNKAYEFGDVITEDITAHDKIFILNRYYPAVPADYTLVHEFAYNDLVYGYFVKQ